MDNHETKTAPIAGGPSSTVVLGTVSQTARGFELVKFADRYGAPCSLQASSLAEYEKPGTSAVWLGTDDADPKVLASKARSLGVDTAERTGWVPYPIPSDVSLTTRMHLDRDQVAALIRHLQNWLDHDSFEVPNVAVRGATPIGGASLSTAGFGASADKKEGA